MGIKVRTNDVRQAGERARARIAGEPQGPGWLGDAGRSGSWRARPGRPSRSWPTRSAGRRGGRSSSTRERRRFATPPGRRSASCARVTSTAEGKLEALTQGGSRVAPERRRDPARPRRVDPLPRPEGAEGLDQHQRRARDARPAWRGARTPGCGTSSAREAEKIEGVWGVAEPAAPAGRSRRRGARARLTARRRTSGGPPPAGRSRAGCARGPARDARPRPASSGGPPAARSRAASAPAPHATHGCSPGISAPIGTSSTPADRARAADVEATVVDRRPGARPRLERPDLPVDLDRRPAPVDPAVRPRERMDVGRGALVLGLGLDLATSPLLEDRRDDLRGQVREPRLELGRRLPPGERHRPARDDRPGVELLGHDHQRHAALRVAGEDRARHRRRAPVTRQERRVDVERRPLPDLQEVGRHDLAVGHEHEAIRDRTVAAPRARRRSAGASASGPGCRARGRRPRSASPAAGAAGRPADPAG